MLWWIGDSSPDQWAVWHLGRLSLFINPKIVLSGAKVLPWIMKNSKIFDEILSKYSGMELCLLNYCAIWNGNILCRNAVAVGRGHCPPAHTHSEGELEIIITKHKGLSVMGREPDTCRRRSVMDHQRCEDREEGWPRASSALIILIDEEPEMWC